jgi:hypothetical protein
VLAVINKQLQVSPVTMVSIQYLVLSLQLVVAVVAAVLQMLQNVMVQLAVQAAVADRTQAQH